MIINNRINRREFLQTGGMLALAAAAMPELYLKGQKHVGVQLWSVREDMFKDAAGTIAALSKMGYREVEGFGFNEGKFFGKTPAEFKKILADNGIKMPSCHAMYTGKDLKGSSKALPDNFKKAVEASAETGQKYLIFPYMLEEDRKGDSLKLLLDTFNLAGEHCKSMGLQFGYHNHDFEFKPVDGKMLYDHIIEKTDPKLCVLEMDLYWVHFAGQKPLDWIAKVPGRVHLAHIKDMAKTDKRETCEVGEGSINFQEVFDKQKLAGLKYMIVELENYKRTPLQGVDVALQNLKKLNFR